MMTKALNMWSFVASLFCVILFFIIPSFNSIFGLHPLYVLLFITLLTFVTGLFGFMGIQSFSSAVRSIATTVCSLSLSAVLVYVLFIGELLR